MIPRDSIDDVTRLSRAYHCGVNILRMDVGRWLKPEFRWIIAALAAGLLGSATFVAPWWRVDMGKAMARMESMLAQLPNDQGSEAMAQLQTQMPSASIMDVTLFLRKAEVCVASVCQSASEGLPARFSIAFWVGLAATCLLAWSAWSWYRDEESPVASYAGTLSLGFMICTWLVGWSAPDQFADVVTRGWGVGAATVGAALGMLVAWFWPSEQPVWSYSGTR